MSPHPPSPSLAQVASLALVLSGVAALWFRATWVYLELSRTPSWFLVLALPVCGVAGLSFAIARRAVGVRGDAKAVAALATMAVGACHLLLWAYLLWAAAPLLPGMAGIPGSRVRSPVERLAAAAVLTLIGLAVSWACSRQIGRRVKHDAIPTWIGVGAGVCLLGLSAAGGRLVEAARLGIVSRTARGGPDSDSRIEALRRLTEEQDPRALPLLKERALRPVAPRSPSERVAPERRSERGDSWGDAFEERVAAITLLANFPEGLDTLVEIAASDPVPDARASATSVLVYYARDPRVQGFCVSPCSRMRTRRSVTGAFESPPHRRPSYAMFSSVVSWRIRTRACASKRPRS